MTDDTYPIQARVPATPEPAPLNLTKVRASLEALDVGGGFVIPSMELRDREGKYRTTSFGQRIHALARALGLKITTTKLPEGLRVRREK